MLKLPSGGAIRYPPVRDNGPMTQYLEPAHTKMLSEADMGHIHKTTSDMMDHEITRMERKVMGRNRKRTADNFLNPKDKIEVQRKMQRAKLHEIVGPGARKD